MVFGNFRYVIGLEMLNSWRTQNFFFMTGIPRVYRFLFLADILYKSRGKKKGLNDFNFSQNFYRHFGPTCMLFCQISQL